MFHIFIKPQKSIVFESKAGISSPGASLKSKKMCLTRRAASIHQCKKIKVMWGGESAHFKLADVHTNS